MEKTYWLSRKRASLTMARKAGGSEARLIHYDLAGRYDLKAKSEEKTAIERADAVPKLIYAADRASGRTVNDD